MKELCKLGSRTENPVLHFTSITLYQHSHGEQKGGGSRERKGVEGLRMSFHPRREAQGFPRKHVVGREGKISTLAVHLLQKLTTAFKNKIQRMVPGFPPSLKKKSERLSREGKKKVKKKGKTVPHCSAEAVSSAFTAIEASLKWTHGLYSFFPRKALPIISTASFVKSIHFSSEMPQLGGAGPGTRVWSSGTLPHGTDGAVASSPRPLFCEGPCHRFGRG